MLAARTSFSAQIAARFGGVGSFTLPSSTEELPTSVADPILIQPLPRSTYTGTSILKWSIGAEEQRDWRADYWVEHSIKSSLGVFSWGTSVVTQHPDVAC